MKQEHGEGVHAYMAKVLGKANICTKKCSCNATVSYSDEIV